MMCALPGAMRDGYIPIGEIAIDARVGKLKAGGAELHPASRTRAIDRRGASVHRGSTKTATPPVFPVCETGPSPVTVCDRDGCGKSVPHATHAAKICSSPCDLPISPVCEHLTACVAVQARDCILHNSTPGPCSCPSIHTIARSDMPNPQRPGPAHWNCGMGVNATFVTTGRRIEHQ